eukprot:1008796-Rhodomonas_salina.1
MQSVISSLPTLEIVLDGHPKQTDPAVTFRYFPASHAVHVPDPFTPLYVPTTHELHSTPSAPANPILQMQSVTLSLPNREFVFTGQLRHAVPAVELKYDPATQAHSTHAAPSEPSYPISHTQSAIASLPASELVWSGHGRHDVSFKYCPASQREHTPDPLNGLKAPLGHTVQAAPSDPSNPMLQMQSVISSLPTL